MSYISIHARMLKNTLDKASFGDIFKATFFASVGGVFILGLYFGAYRLLAYIANVPYIGTILIYKLLSLIFLTTFIMVAFSSLITSLNSVYFSRELHLLFTLPINPERIFLFKAFESAVFSSWMVLAVMFPFIAAFAVVHKLSLLFYVCAFVAAVPYVLIASFLGILVIMVLFYFFPSSKLRDSIFIMLMLVGSGVYLAFRLIQPERLVNADVFQHVLQYITLIQAPTAIYLPSWWLAEIIRTYAMGEWGNFSFYMMMLWGIAGLLVYGNYLISRNLYFESWNQAGVTEKSRPFSISAYTKRSRLVSGLTQKEILLFFRTPEQWPQLILMGALVIIYLFSIYRLPLDSLYLKNLISFLNIGFAGFVMSAVALRFVYPVVSLEGRSFWLIKSLPVNISRFIAEKWLMCLGPIVLLGNILVGISCYLLASPPFVMIFSILSITALSCGLTSLGIGFGALFPKFTVANIARIESSAGGVFFMITALAYVGVTIALEAVIMQAYFYGQFRQAFDTHNVYFAGIISALVVLHLLAAIVPLYWGRRSLERYEFEVAL